jgi:preprotein translocase subunit SecG
MFTLVVIIHVIVCIALILIVLLQAGKGASMGAAFGGSSQTIFGSSGATPFLAKMTTGVAVIFMVTSLFLAFMSGPRSGGSLVKPATPAAEQKQAPAQTPATPPASAPTPANPAVPATPAPPAAK